MKNSRNINRLKAKYGGLCFLVAKAAEKIGENLMKFFPDYSPPSYYSFCASQGARIGAGAAAAVGLDGILTALDDKIIKKKMFRGAVPLLASTLGAAGALCFLSEHTQLPYSTDFFENTHNLISQYHYSLSNLVKGNFPYINAPHLAGALIYAKNAGKLAFNLVGGLAGRKPRKERGGEAGSTYTEA